MRDLVAGFLRFRRDVFPLQAELFKSLAHEQKPRTLFIACSDSRVIPELVTQCEPGDLFVVRNAGNIVPSHGSLPGGVSAAIEYAVAVLAVADIVVCGHSGCGAMSAIAADQNLSHLPAVAAWLRHADAARAVNAAECHESVHQRIEALVRGNVVAQLDNLRTHPSVAVALKQQRLALHGWVFDIERGQIETYDDATRSFVLLATP